MTNKETSALAMTLSWPVDGAGLDGNLMRASYTTRHTFMFKCIQRAISRGVPPAAIPRMTRSEVDAINAMFIARESA